VDQVHLRREAREVGRLLQGRIAPTHHGHLLAAVEEAVAGGAGGHAPAYPQSNANLYGIEYENQTAIKSNIMDADIGAEVVNLTKWQILSQAGTSALSNANAASQTVLGLLR